jgi:hypothetical protein
MKNKEKEEKEKEEKKPKNEENQKKEGSEEIDEKKIEEKKIEEMDIGNDSEILKEENEEKIEEKIEEKKIEDKIRLEKEKKIQKEEKNLHYHENVQKGKKKIQNKRKEVEINENKSEKKNKIETIDIEEIFDKDKETKKEKVKPFIYCTENSIKLNENHKYIKGTKGKKSIKKVCLFDIRKVIIENNIEITKFYKKNKLVENNKIFLDSNEDILTFTTENIQYIFGGNYKKTMNNEINQILKDIGIVVEKKNIEFYHWDIVNIDPKHDEQTLFVYENVIHENLIKICFFKNSSKNYRNIGFKFFFFIFLDCF